MIKKENSGLEDYKKLSEEKTTQLIRVANLEAEYSIRCFHLLEVTIKHEEEKKKEWIDAMNYMLNKINETKMKVEIINVKLDLIFKSITGV